MAFRADSAFKPLWYGKIGKKDNENHHPWED